MSLHASLHHESQRKWCEPHLHASQLIYPVFVTNREEDRQISGFEPNLQWGWGQDKNYISLVEHLRSLIAMGLESVMLFGVVESKDATGTVADTEETPVIVCTRTLRKELPSLLIATDVCLCEYTDHGHCGLLRSVDNEAVIDNSPTLDRLAAIAVSYARAGAHIVCPSDMMDNRIATIRKQLNAHGFQHVSIMAYTSKKASCMYAPFRNAVDSTFQGDRKRYQQPIGSIVHANRAFERDVAEGADSVIVKPSLFYGDIVQQLASKSIVPVVCYVVSGEYKMLKDYGESSDCMADVVREAHLSLLRAGASVLITYFTPYILGEMHAW